MAIFPLVSLYDSLSFDGSLFIYIDTPYLDIKNSSIFAFELIFHRKSSSSSVKSQIPKSFT